MNILLKYIFIILVNFTSFVFINTQTSVNLFDCPNGWETHTDHCYRFVLDPIKSLADAKQECSRNGGYLLSINSDAEHEFVQEQLSKYDASQQKKNWWTSGKRQVSMSNNFFWEGDGSKIESFVYWRNPEIPKDYSKNYIMYNHDGFSWMWILGVGNENSPFVCEVAKADIYKITYEERGPDYGVENPDPSTIERGPRFTLQPQTVIHQRDDPGDAFMECKADSYPYPTYTWNRERAGSVMRLDAKNSTRYTFIGGKVVIKKPSALTGDDGNYFCEAGNKFGVILSNSVRLVFGYLEEFTKSSRAPVEAAAYRYAIIECSPPDHFPPELVYTWFKTPRIAIRPDRTPYLMISMDGRLYFSQVTEDDSGDYYCVVSRSRAGNSDGKVSLPTRLIVNPGSPGDFLPQIGSNFPAIFPKSPKVGDTVRIECWALGNSQPPLVYSWRRIERRPDGSVRDVKLPVQAQLEDHNRRLVIRNVQLFNNGVYVCKARHLLGSRAEKEVTLSLKAEPYFTVAIRDRFADEGSDLRWRCEAGGNPDVTYNWFRNGKALADQLNDADRARYTINNNVLNIKSLTAGVDDGMYQCSASNTLATRYSSGQLKVLKFAPSFAKYPLPENQFATLRGNTTLYCRPEAAPYPTLDQILWFKDGRDLAPPTDDTSRVRKLVNGHLLITGISTQDAGHYKCSVTNKYGSDSTAGNLTIFEEIQIVRKPEQVPVLVNTTRFLHCIASYDPQIDVTYVWWHASRLVEFEKVFRLGENRFQVWRNPTYKRGNKLYNGGLYIFNAQHEHAGIYTCEVHSPTGSISASVDLEIIGPPYEPSGLTTIVNSPTNTTARLRWKAPPEGQNTSPDTQIISYVIESLNAYEGFWKIHKTNLKLSVDSQRDIYYTVTDLRPYSNYSLRVRAENRLGTSIPSKTTTFLTLSTKPDLYPEEVGGGGGKEGTLVISWKPLPKWEHNGGRIGYQVYWRNKGDVEFDNVREVKGNVGFYTAVVGQVNFYREYEVQVQARNEMGYGPISPLQTVMSAMKLPTARVTNVMVEPKNATACVVRWTPAPYDRESFGGILGGFRVSYYKEFDPADNAPRVTIVGEAVEGLVIGLDPDTRYIFTVMIWNEAGNAPATDPEVQRTLRKAPINPPVEVQVYRIDTHSIHVYWRGVSTAHDEEPLEGYKVRVWRQGETSKVGTDYDAGKEVDLKIVGLRGDVEYRLRVLGYSRGGDGTLSSPAMKFVLGSASFMSSSISTLLFVLILQILYR